MSERKERRLARRAARVAAARATGLSAPFGRLRAHLHAHLIDHAWLRVFWTNFAPIADGVYRSNQPSPARVRRYARMGIKAILNLRSETGQPFHMLESDACAKAGIALWDLDHGFSARRAPKAQTLLTLIDMFHRIPRPFVLHCKSGADRAGLASAIYLMVFQGQTAAQAMQQLSLRHIHLKHTSTGIMDHILRVYAQEAEPKGIAFADWLQSGYDRDAITRSFQAWRKGQWPTAAHTGTAPKPRDDKAA